MNAEEAKKIIEFEIQDFFPTCPDIRTAFATLRECVDAGELIEASLAPYRGEDACPNRAYTVSREAVKALRKALKGEAT